MRPKFPEAFELFYAVFEGTAADVRERLTAGDDPNACSADGRTPLTFAVYSARDLAKANLLFEAGARVDVWDLFGMQSIHWVTGSTYRDDVRCLSWLLDRGADPSAPVRPPTGDKYHAIGWAPLHIAADRASLAATRFLIDRHANVRASSADGSTALHVAAGKYRVYKRLMRMLLDAGADIDAADSAGRTPLHVLAKGHGRYRKSAIRFLRHRNACLDARDRDGRRPADLVPEGFPATAAIRRLLDVPSGPRTSTNDPVQ
ncbi:MAG TPA: ankyrin repeat domain-containing protein [Humisphaera sp.]|jgi:ankyrin repeat protein|nr:ankyrin repeat domain-containing protein [Humisphaera sp.]